jgi:hypothetical protein
MSSLCQSPEAPFLQTASGRPGLSSAELPLLQGVVRKTSLKDLKAGGHRATPTVRRDQCNHFQPVNIEHPSFPAGIPDDVRLASSAKVILCGATSVRSCQRRRAATHVIGWLRSRCHVATMNPRASSIGQTPRFHTTRAKSPSQAPNL